MNIPDDDLLDELFGHIDDDDWSVYFWLVEMGLIETAYIVYGMVDAYITLVEKRN